MSYKFYTGELGMPKPKKPLPVLRTFRGKITKQGQSQNIEDKRVFNPQYVGNHLVQVFGYLTRNTWFHLASQVKYDIMNALQSRGFGIIFSYVTDRNRANSQYNFEVHLRVFDRYTTQQVKDSLVYALEQTIALPNSVRIINIYDYQK